MFKIESLELDLHLSPRVLTSADVAVLAFAMCSPTRTLSYLYASNAGYNFVRSRMIIESLVNYHHDNSTYEEEAE